MASREAVSFPRPEATWTVREVLESRAAVVLLVAGVLLRLLYGAWADLPYRDGIAYDAIAHNLLARGEYSAPYQLRSPGYPFFLAGVYAVFGEGHAAVRTVQALLDAATAIVVLAIAQRLGLSRQAATLAMGLALFHPSTFLYSAMILSECLATFLVTAGTWLLLQALVRGERWALAFGATLSAAALTRPSFARN
jgi:4-amino-4-deoxy-L-arabinose transferase-like glycosyltransferase